jgi:hypothetical protein
VRIQAWEREKFRLNKGNIFPSRKSLVSDIPAGEGKTAKPFFTVRGHFCVQCKSLLTINVCFVYMGRDVWIWMAE